MTVTDARSALWIRRFEPAPDAPVRLVCFPHAGGSATFFLELAKDLSPDVEVLAVQYPGRQDRRKEPLVETVTGLAESVAAALLPWADRGLALFGHSLGSIVAYEVARLLWDKGHEPVALFASGRRAPSVHRTESGSHADDDTLLRALRSLGGTHPTVFDDEELLRLALPVIRADYVAAETYQYRPGPPLSCPLTMLTGEDDPMVSPQDAAAWREHTSAEFDVITLPGGHFYLTEQHAAVTRAITDRLAELTRPV
ncbi:alpha/beta fold hydrolase [Streptomyces parvus]|uniref:thioesterase II family protein n=1 Tax=Streptomyces parvus TaxID=66428 RepID=UPI00344666DC